MKVLYLNHTAQVSGGERSLLDLLGALPRSVAPVAASPEGPLAALVRDAGIEHRPVRGTAGSLKVHPSRTTRAGLELLRAARSVRSLVRDVAPDIVHANSIRAGIIAGIAAERGGPPLVVHIRDCLPPGAASGAALGFVGRRAAALVANSEYTASSLGSRGSRAPLRVIYSPVDARRFDPARVVPARLEPANGDVVLGLVAQITPWKGQREAVETLAALRSRGLAAHLVLVGSTTFVDRATRLDNRSYLADLRARIEALGLGDRVSMLGARDDVPELMAAFDLVLVPSWEEPMGRAVLEAMAMERPVIATSVGGPAEIVEDGMSGFLRDPHRAELWADVICGLARDPVLRSQIGTRARARAIDRFGLERHVRLMHELYDSVETPQS